MSILHYQLQNNCTEHVFVGHLALDAAFKQYANSAYAALSCDGNRLNLLLGISPLPYDQEVEFAVSPLYINLRPRELLTGQIELPIQINEWDAYHLANTDLEGELVSVKEILLMIDVVPQSKIAHVHAAKFPAQHWVVSGQTTRLRCLVIPKCPIQVWKRADNFPRH